MISSTSFIHCLCIVICCLQCKCTLSSVLSEENKSIAHILRQKPVNLQLPQEANEVNPFRAASSSSTNIARISTRHSPHRQPATLSSTLYRSYVLIQTGLCSDIDCENIPTAEACHTYVQSQGGNFVFFEEVASTRPSGCFTFGFTENQWHFNSAKPSTNIAKREGGNTGYRFVCDCRSSLLATSTKSTQDRLEMKSRGLTETRMVHNRRRLAACSSISTSGWNEWSASCSMSTTHSVAEDETVKIKKSASMVGELIIDRGATSGVNQHFIVYGALEMEDVTLTGGYDTGVSSFCSLHSL